LDHHRVEARVDDVLFNRRRRRRRRKSSRECDLLIESEVISFVVVLFFTAFTVAVAVVVTVVVSVAVVSHDLLLFLLLDGFHLYLQRLISQKWFLVCNFSDRYRRHHNSDGREHGRSRQRQKAPVKFPPTLIEESGHYVL
jgi:hypothetical protein